MSARMTALLLWARKEEFFARGARRPGVDGDRADDGGAILRAIKGKIGLTLDYPQFETIWCDIFTANAEVLALARLLGKTTHATFSQTPTRCI